MDSVLYHNTLYHTGQNPYIPHWASIIDNADTLMVMVQDNLLGNNSVGNNIVWL